MKLSEALPPASIPKYPFMTELGVGSHLDPDSVTLVDIGGGRGQFIEALTDANPTLPGRLILQDLPAVIDSLEKSSLGFEAMVHDFFTPQPVIDKQIHAPTGFHLQLIYVIPGARWSYPRRVLHDWPDADCLTVLRHTAHACKRGYSTLLITEFALPDTGVGQQEALVDLNMMILNGMERSDMQGRGLLERAGLVTKRVWGAQTGSLAAIEAEWV
jgi:hypothetical protein